MNLLCLLGFHTFAAANPRFHNFTGECCIRCPETRYAHTDEYTRFVHYVAKLPPEKLQPYMTRQMEAR